MPDLTSRESLKSAGWEAFDWRGVDVGITIL